MVVGGLRSVRSREGGCCRYIADRFLPDKAIDLVDEAAASLRLEITSKPQALDELDRRVLQLDMERVSISKSKGAPRPHPPLQRTSALRISYQRRSVDVCMQGRARG